MNYKLSIITINLNNSEGLKETILSVVNQTYKSFEFIVIDGDSTDNSVKVIRDFEDDLTYWHSEPDKGIYNAMNKGIRKANGDFVLFLNSGDVLYDAFVLEKVLEKVVEKLETNVQLYYGDVLLKHNDKKWEKVQEHPSSLPFSYFYTKTICQQSCFFKRSIFEEMFSFNEDYKICADWEFLIYAIYIKKIIYKKLDIIIATYDMQGISSTTTYREIAKKEREMTMQKYFPLFNEDYKRLAQFASKKHEQLRYIEQFPFVRKMISVLFNFLILILPNRKK